PDFSVHYDSRCYKINKLAIITGKTWMLFLQKPENFPRCLIHREHLINAQSINFKIVKFYITIKIRPFLRKT
ncbi:MAG: hypothetical protein LUQ26_06375, partial [Methylococcaceae bacterium]|nr:hypothetical protein [Methylococcaceae bacterium]